MLDGIADPTPKMIKEAFFEKIMSDDRSMQKQAQDAVNDFVRVRMREDGYYRKIIPPVQISNDELDRQVDTDKPVKIVDKEPNSPAAISIPFGSLPVNQYIQGPRFRVMFDRIVTSRFTKDVEELRTWDMDIRQVLSDNAIKDMLAEEDSKAMAAIDLLIGSTSGSTVAATGTVQYQSISGGVSRDNVNEALKIMNRTPSHLETATILCNHVTIKDVQKWGFDEAGGSWSEEILRNGFSERSMLNCRWIVSIKRDLVPDGSLFMFAEPKFLGKHYLLEDTTMYIDRKAYMLEFFAYECLGSSIANVAGVTRADFD